jgi:predicted membrane-bound spermidine synthase
LLLAIVIIGGVSTMAIQMTASRLVQTYFGSSLVIWANLIGFTMVCLALGYYIGGRLSERYPRPALLYRLTLAAGLYMALIPLINNPVLDVTKALGQLFGSLLGIMLIFGVPLTLMGCVAPFAVRLLVSDVKGAGRIAGMVSSLSTIGSIAGTFLPVLWLMPSLGTRLTIYIFSALLVVCSLAGWLTVRGKAAPAPSEPEKAANERSVTAQKSADKKAEAEVNTLTPFLWPIVFICGVASIAIEMCASRLIQPYFGDSLIIWACIIGFIIIYLSIGYYLGGRLGDRFPRPNFLYQLTGLAAFALGLIPVLSTPIFNVASEGFRTADGFLFFGSLLGIIVLFAIPVILLGCVSPFAVRLLVRNVRDAGRTAGKVSSLSTIGSIAGSFLPVLVFIPTFGTRTTLYIFSLTLLVFSTIGLFMTARRRAPVFAALTVVVILLAAFVTFGIKTAANGTLLAEKESAYNYIQVVKRANGEIDLVLNEGHAVHSIYNPNQVLTGGPWDQYMITPFFNANITEKDVKSMLMLGLGAGTVPKQLTKAYGSQVQIDGVEIDPEIIALGKQYFDMNEPNLNAIAEDGRYSLITSHKKYDIIGVDAYKQPYIPFHMTTKEFFQQVRDHLTPTGVAVINAGTPAVSNKIDYRLAETLAQTMKTVYPNVYMINLYKSSGYYNTIVVATNQPTSLANFKKNITQVVTNSLIKQVGQKALDSNSIEEWTGVSKDSTPPLVLTDDRAPIEQIIDQVIIDYVTAGGK